MALDLWQIDAFTDRPYRGNPAAVCLLHERKSDEWMQNVAAEMNLAETAFLLRTEEGFGLRWFTPAIEVDLCGHATLASAHFLWEEGHLKPRATARFETRSGLLTAHRKDGWITLDFPATPATTEAPPPGLVEALGKTPTWFAKSRFDYLAVYDDEATIRALTPDLALLSRFPVRGVIVTGPGSTAENDFVSRFFAPAAGVPEDPVTGSAHCTLGPYWGDRTGKQDLVGYQASKRGGTVKVGLRGDRCLLAGQAVTVLRGSLEDA